jgi:hypothetical protein
MTCVDYNQISSTVYPSRTHALRSSLFVAFCRQLQKWDRGKVKSRHFNAQTSTRSPLLSALFSLSLPFSLRDTPPIPTPCPEEHRDKEIGLILIVILTPNRQDGSNSEITLKSKFMKHQVQDQVHLLIPIQHLKRKKKNNSRMILK